MNVKTVSVFNNEIPKEQITFIERQEAELADGVGEKVILLFQLACQEALDKSQNLIDDLQERTIIPSTKLINEFEVRVKNVFNKVIEQLYPLYVCQPIVFQIKQFFNLSDEDIKGVFKAATADFVKPFIDSCDAQYPELVDKYYLSK